MENIYKNLHTNQKILIYEMLKRGINVEVLDEKLEIIKSNYQGHEEILFDRDSSIMPYSLSILAGDKGITKKILENNNISVPLGEVFKANDVENILKAFDIIKPPVVLKPVNGSHGYDVYTDINTKEELLACLKSLVKNRGITNVLIEEYFEAKEYRVFITKNKDYAILNRDSASVIGDGVHSIEELIAIENYRRFHPRTNALCEILVDGELHKYLAKQNLSIAYIPEDKEKVYLRPNSNVAMGGLCIDATDIVDSSVIDIAYKVLMSFPGLPYIGIDYMTNSIDQKQDASSYRIIEVNTVPGIHMHFRPAVGKSRNIAEYIVDMIYPETKIKKEDDYNEKFNERKPSILPR